MGGSDLNEKVGQFYLTINNNYAVKDITSLAAFLLIFLVVAAAVTIGSK